MLSLVDMQQRVVGGLGSSFADFERAKRMVQVLKDTVHVLEDFPTSSAIPSVGTLVDLFGKPVDARLLLGFAVGSTFVIPARQSLNPTVPGAVELNLEVHTPDGIATCGGYIFESLSIENSSATVTLKLVATFTSLNPTPEGYDPEPEFLTSGLLWKLSFAGGFTGKVFLGSQDLLTWMESLGRPAPLRGPVGGVGGGTTSGSANLQQQMIVSSGSSSGAIQQNAVASAVPAGKVGFTINTDADGRQWRSSSWEKFQGDYAGRINLIRSASRERYKFIAGEHVVRVDHEYWKNKLLAYEHVLPCPEWANTISHLHAVRVLNIYGKEELFFSGECSRVDYSLISWEQFIPKGVVYDRKGSFNSLSVALEGFRVASVFYYGRAWENVGRQFKLRLESGDLVNFLPEYVNYLAHGALLHYYSILLTSTTQVGYTFEDDDAAPKIFDQCLAEGVTSIRLEDANYWIKFNSFLKEDIHYSIQSKRKLLVDDGDVNQQKSSKKSAGAHPKVPAVKRVPILGEREFVCWSCLEAHWNLKLERTHSKWKKPCMGAPQCKNVHINFANLPSEADFLANLRFSKTLTPGDVKKLEKEIVALY